MAETDIKLSINEINRYLSIAKSIKGSHLYYDMHVHPFEVVFNKGDYKNNHEVPGLYSTKESEFYEPKISEVILSKQEEKTVNSGLFLKPAIFRLKFSSLYTHTGPKVFDSQMRLSNIDRILLLPVAPYEGNVNSQITDMNKFFSNDKRFFFSWSVSNDIENSDIYNAACNAVKNYDICTVKQNLSTTEINISTSIGKERFECILDSCTKLSLPIILHSGKSPIAKNDEIGRYGTIEILEKFSWGNFNCPIVFAHSAAYGYSEKEIRKQIIPVLKNMVFRHDNLFIDVSGIDTMGLKIILDSIPTERIIFGSDALYEDQWQRVVKLLYALDKSSVDLETGFLKIMSQNPENHIIKFRESLNKYKSEETLLSQNLSKWG